MNIGTIWPHLDSNDKKLMTEAIYHFGAVHPSSYCYIHRAMQWDDPKLVFLKLKPVYYALQFYRNNTIMVHSPDKTKIDKMIHLIDLVIR